MSDNTETRRIIRANVLGDVRAESDSAMLNLAFYESPDYRTLIESPDRCIVVGRRGTGKSALAYKLGSYFEKVGATTVIRIAPDEDEIIGLRPLTELFGSQFRTMRAGATIAWRYGLFMEIANALRHKYKVKNHSAFALLDQHLENWNVPNSTFANRVKQLLRRTIQRGTPPEEVVGDLPGQLAIRDVGDGLKDVLLEAKTNVVILLDRLDEGYQPDDVGIGLFDGLMQAAIDVRSKLEATRPILFLRDNIYRAVAKLDPDFSRTIEGQTLRLHWDEYNLLNLTANRLRTAFDVDLEQSIRVWDRCSASGLDGKEGFRKCLRLTLYRPRDLLILLNNAFLTAAQQERTRIVPADLDSSARSISVNRLEDLRKEYTKVLPSLTVLTEAFSNTEPEMTVEGAKSVVQPLIDADDWPTDIKQYFAIIRSAEVCLRDLYSVGFVGLKESGNSANANFVFSHDGRDPDVKFNTPDKLLVHPCYWIALNLANRELSPDSAQEIYDEYEIKVSSETPKRREAEIGTLIAKEGSIPHGHGGWADFETWALRAVQIVFAARLTNIQLHPNKDAIQRRDVVGTNMADSPFWKRIREDYGTRQTVFEVKNYDVLTPEDFRQALSYSTGEYGKCLFFIARTWKDDLPNGPELDWVRTLYHEHGRLVMKISSKSLSRLLAKLRSPQKHDVTERYMGHLIDQYIRLYLNLPRSSGKRSK